jgi:hypothetical protein
MLLNPRLSSPGKDNKEVIWMKRAGKAKKGIGNVKAVEGTVE